MSKGAEELVGCTAKFSDDKEFCTLMWVQDGKRYHLDIPRMHALGLAAYILEETDDET